MSQRYRYWSPAEDALVLRRTAEGATLPEIAAEIGATKEAVKQRRRRLDGRLPNGAKAEPMYAAEQRTTEKLEVEAKGDTEVITAHSATIRDLDSLLAAAKVDLDVWEVERWVANKWDQGSKGPEGRLSALELWQVKAWLRRRKTAGEALATKELARRLERHAPKYPKFTRPKRPAGAHMLELSLYDCHLGKLAWGPETGQNYDLKIAERLYREAGKDLARKAAAFPLEKIILPVGQDFYHIDTPSNTTTAGTPQDTDGRLAKIFATGRDAVIGMVDYLLNLAPVHLIWVGGNHDYFTSLWLAHVLAAHYRHCEDVTVDDSPCPRKCVEYGATMICCTHGVDEKPDALPMLMASEWRDVWGRTKYHEVHCGHLHTPSETHYRSVDVHGGVIRRVLPSLAGADHFHHKRGYIGSARAAQALLYHREEGHVATFNSHVREG